MSPALLPGSLFARRYRIISPLARGGMSIVYRAEHVGLRKEIALKILAATFVSPDLGARFDREARTAARLDHRGCVRILDHGQTASYRYLAMELVEGPTLATVMRREGRLSTRQAVAYVCDLLGALAHAHAHGVLHRDVKPENAIVRHGPEPHVVLIDFGLARRLEDAALTAAGMCIGSPSYLAPERLLNRYYDARADLYAVGVILYEMLAGARPFAGGCAEEIVRAHLGRPARPLRAIRWDVSPSLERVVMKALAKDPELRFATAGEMLSALLEAPVADEQETMCAAPARDDEATTLTLATPPSFVRRAWAWFRHGEWRWAQSAGR